MVERYQAILAAEAAELKKRLPEGKLADMFERCYLNTIDEAVKELEDGSLFVITGDIEAMWLRCITTYQLRPGMRKSMI